MWLSEDTLQPIADVLQTPLFQLSVVTTMLLLSVYFCACVSVLVELTPRVDLLSQRNAFICTLSSCPPDFGVFETSCSSEWALSFPVTHDTWPAVKSATLKFLFYLLILSLYYGIYTMKFKLCIFHKMKRNMGCIIVIRCCSYSDYTPTF